ncbi:pistil-specific extensin-like protein [Miscanthus floridulus]|uniref:pistil-specific extensin-like protein n=1 Tax=Miscanthus floridulus TaxID=154761 RepID=UPI003457E0E4
MPTQARPRSVRHPPCPHWPAPAPHAAILTHAGPPSRYALPSAPTPAYPRPSAARRPPLPVHRACGRPHAHQPPGHTPALALAPAPACGRAWPGRPRRPTNAEEPALPPAVPRGPPAPTLPVPDPVPDSNNPDPDPDAARPYPRRPSGMPSLLLLSW